jgi:hypothetical protein
MRDKSDWSGRAATGAARAVASPRLAVTGPMVAPMPRPSAKVAAASRMPALPALVDKSLV